MNERDALRMAFRTNPKMARMLKKMMDKGQLKPPDPDSTEPLMVICKRWPGLVDDCRMALCSSCGAEVALAPSSQQMIDSSRAEVSIAAWNASTMARWRSAKNSRRRRKRPRRRPARRKSFDLRAMH